MEVIFLLVGLGLDFKNFLGVPLHSHREDVEDPGSIAQHPFGRLDVGLKEEDEGLGTITSNSPGSEPGSSWTDQGESELTWPPAVFDLHPAA